jgi:hypothetical protein
VSFGGGRGKAVCLTGRGFDHMHVVAGHRLDKQLGMENETSHRGSRMPLGHGT